MLPTAVFPLRHREFASFGLIGILNTVLHGILAIVLVEKGVASPVGANAMAFFCANVFSYQANCRITFRCSRSLKNYLGFLAASLAGLGLSLAFASLAEYLRWHYLVGLALVLGATPMITFVLLRKFTFRPAATNPAKVAQDP